MLYFAYGSNLNLTQMKSRCPDSKPLFKAYLHDYELIFTGKVRKIRGGVATIRLSKGKEVFGAGYEISERDLSSLDRYEGYPDFYDRITVKVFTQEGNSLGNHNLHHERANKGDKADASILSLSKVIEIGEYLSRS